VLKKTIVAATQHKSASGIEEEAHAMSTLARGLVPPSNVEYHYGHPVITR
jgi:hypothetical protein